MLPLPTNLPLKELSLFKRAVKCYENQQYKNGVKFLNQILANTNLNEHPETLASKGLLLYCMGRREEGYELVKSGIKKEIKSFFCWHTYGILYRSDRNYIEAIKCFNNAIRWDDSNVQILTELSVLQMQCREFEQYLETRSKIFQKSPTQRTSWVGFAIAYHLNCDYRTCLQVLESFRKTLISCGNISPYEFSELLSFENLVLEESGDIEGALRHLTDNQCHILDTVTLLEKFAKYNILLKNSDEAVKNIEKLLERNPENIAYYNCLFDALNLKSEEEKYSALIKVFKKMPKARLPKRLALNFIYGKHFLNDIDVYLQINLRKGVPPLFLELKNLYKDELKVSAIESIVLNYANCLLNLGIMTKESTQMEPPTTILWVHYYLAQHFSHLRNIDQALKYINLAISHTPTMPELFMVKGRIYKRAGDYETASDCLLHAMKLDYSDRYINSKCALYHFRANKVRLAEQVASRFSSENVYVMDFLSEMQCIWYLLEYALAFERLNLFGEALKKCHEIDRIFTQMYQDQMDFHTYCLRGLSIRPYINLIRYEVKIKASDNYEKAALCAIRIYLKLFDKPQTEPEVAVVPEVVVQEETSLTSSELRKKTRKEKKAQKKAELNKAAAAKRPTVHPHQDCYRDTKTPLQDALNFALPLEQLRPNKITTHLSIFEINYRRQKDLLMLQAIKKAYAIDPENPYLHEIIVKFTLHTFRRKDLNLIGFPIFDVINYQMQPIWAGRTIIRYNEDFVRRNNNVLARCLAARSMYLIDTSKKSEALKLCMCLDSSTVKGITVKNCSTVIRFMEVGLFGPCRDEIIDYIVKCHKLFPYAAMFMIPEPTDADDHFIATY